MSKVSYLTAEGLKKLKEELQDMERVQRPAISAQIAEARDKGDLSENAEYDAAKEAQGLLELKISKVKNIVANSRVVDAADMDTSQVRILSKVTIRNLKNGMEMIYTLVSESEADLRASKISIESPMGTGLLGKKPGETTEIETPGGSMEFEIIHIGH
ncbi:MAG TPA: transcription elongation factor GreA [Flavobacteriales bacterium]|jgi:transcription elongation factor GreA|nr:transcription elongation factor GreA [Salibacteraceae bacterium]HAS35449.1 transcription elongation factor GreA [Flavobacteriales bacterium]